MFAFGTLLLPANHRLVVVILHVIFFHKMFFGRVCGDLGLGLGSETELHEKDPDLSCRIDLLVEDVTIGCTWTVHVFALQDKLAEGIACILTLDPKACMSHFEFAHARYLGFLRVTFGEAAQINKCVKMDAMLVWNRLIRGCVCCWSCITHQMACGRCI